MNEFKITEEKENALFNRKEIKGSIEAEIVPSRVEILEILSKKYRVPLENIKIKKIFGKFGSKIFDVEANIYSLEKDKESIELKKKKEKKPEEIEEKPEEKVVEEPSKEQPAEEKTEEKSTEESLKPENQSEPQGEAKEELKPEEKTEQ